VPLLRDIRERKVVQWIVAYVAVAWVAAQVAEVVTDPWGIPPAWIRTLHLMLAAGLPIAAVLAWYHGATGRQGIRRAEVAILGVIVLGTMALLMVVDTTRFGTPAVPPEATLDAQSDRASRARTLLAESPVDVPRLAVLGFSNLGRPEQGFFADGITAELASRLSGLRKLAMISPNSAESWDPGTQDAAAFGRTLGADFVLAGTVVWDTNDESPAVRVIPSLVRTVDNTQVWSARIERPFVDALTLQAEIAAQVTEQLAIGLSQGEAAALEQPVTDNPLAYETYLRAVQVLPEGHGAEADFRAAERLLTQATTLDPKLLEAWAALSKTHFGLYWFGYDLQPARLEQGRDAMARAIALDPGSDVARLRQADYFYRQRDFDTALGLFAELYADRPNDARVLRHLGYLWRRQGLFESGIEALERSVEFDPLNSYLLVELAWTYLFVDRPERTLALSERARAQDPDAEWTPLMMAAACWSRGGPEALDCARQHLEDSPNPRSTYPARFWMLQLSFEGDLENALLRIENYPDESLVGQAFWIPRDLEQGALLIALGRELEGRPMVERAAVTLRRAIEQNPSDFRLYLSLGKALALLNQPEAALSTAERAAELLPVERDALIGPEVLYALAEVCGMAGADEQALDLMARLLSMPTFHREVWWTHNPAFAGLWNQPRFVAMMERGARSR
jgi:TolB-like protein/Flp pilus assembly protein TadD